MARAAWVGLKATADELENLDFADEMRYSNSDFAPAGMRLQCGT